MTRRLVAAAVLTIFSSMGCAESGPREASGPERASAVQAARHADLSTQGASADPLAPLHGRNEARAEARAKTASAERPTMVGARHILVQWMGAERAARSIVRTREQALAIARDALARARSGEDFARLAVELSDEPGAGARGGSLGRFGRGQMVPAFEQAVFELEVGEISGLVETPFGVHVIQRTE